jgi:hypothetical protein
VADLITIKCLSAVAADSQVKDERLVTTLTNAVI